MTKPKPDITDPRTLAIESLKRLGGIEGFVTWGKTHRTLYYNLYAKLMAQPVVTNFTTIKNNVNIDGEAARRKLESAFLRVIAAQKQDRGTVIVDGEIINNGPSAAVPRLGTDDGISSTPDQPSSIAGPRPANVGDVETSIDPRPVTAAAPVLTPAQARERAMAPQPVNVATGEPSTTAKYLEWSNNSSSQWWANLPGRVK